MAAFHPYLWLINTRAEGEKPGDDGRGRWVWAVFYMKAASDEGQ
jgi:hypothetical protein